MKKPIVFITGASGYLGSAISVDLSRDHGVIGLYRRPPSEQQRRAAPGAVWEKGDVTDPDCLERLFMRCRRAGNPIDYVIHFAAYYHYGEKWREQYCRTNVMGTRNVISASIAAGVRRILFAGSITSLDPPPSGGCLTERAPAGHGIAYSRSKAMGERLLMENAHRLPAAVLRIGGVFTDWCELPPLFSVIRMWSLPRWAGRLVPGRGDSGFPYIHRTDLVRMVRRVIEKAEDLNEWEVFFAAQDGATLHRQLYPLIRRAAYGASAGAPIPVPPVLGRLTLHGKYALNRMLRRRTYERAWMLDYVDRPLVIDASETRRRLGWCTTPSLHILNRLPVLMTHFQEERAVWERRNRMRNDRRYRFEPDL